MGLFSKIPGIDWDYTRLKDAIDALTGETIRRRAQHVILFDAATGEPIVLNGNGTVSPADPQQLTTIADKLETIFPSGVSNFDIIPQLPLTASARALMDVPTLCRTVQILSVRPDGSDNEGRIGIGDSDLQNIYIEPGLGGWGDSAPIGQKLDLSQIFVRAIVPGDCISLAVRF
jgi:hypothetical protein